MNSVGKYLYSSEDNVLAACTLQTENHQVSLQFILCSHPTQTSSQISTNAKFSHSLQFLHLLRISLSKSKSITTHIGIQIW